MGMMFQQFHPFNACLLNTQNSNIEAASGSKFAYTSIAVSATSTTGAYWKGIATNYGGGNLKLGIYWFSNVSSGDVVFGTQIGVISPNTDSDDIETKSLATEQTGTFTNLGTARVQKATLTISNLDGLAKDDWFILYVYRKGADAADTNTTVSNLIMCDLFYKASSNQ